MKITNLYAKVAAIEGGTRFPVEEVWSMGRSGHMAIVDRDVSTVSVRRLCGLLGLARSGVHHAPTRTTWGLMKRIDAFRLERPFYGSRRIRFALRAEEWPVHRKRVKGVMRMIGPTITNA